MWQKLLTILLITIAFIILGVTLYRANKHQPVEENEPSSEVQMEFHADNEQKGVGQIREGEEEGSVENHRGSMAKAEITTYIKEVFGESADWGLGVAFCESSFNPDAESHNGLYFGLFQFSHSTWNRNCEGSIWEWKDQVVCAKKLVDRGEYSRWPNCP